MKECEHILSYPLREPVSGGEGCLSARNQFRGTVKSVKPGKVMAEVVIRAAGLEVISLISRGSVERLNLKEGDEATTVVKVTEVMVEK
ncbi:molybdopterin-binding protein [Chloroflexota bacterium]